MLSWCCLILTYIFSLPHRHKLFTTSRSMSICIKLLLQFKNLKVHVFFSMITFNAKIFNFLHHIANYVVVNDGITIGWDWPCSYGFQMSTERTVWIKFRIWIEHLWLKFQCVFCVFFLCLFFVDFGLCIVFFVNWYLCFRFCGFYFNFESIFPYCI